MGRDLGPIFKDTFDWSLPWLKCGARVGSPVGPRAHIESSRDQSRMAATLPFENLVAAIWIFSLTWLKRHARLVSPVGPRAHIESSRLPDRHVQISRSSASPHGTGPRAHIQRHVSLELDVAPVSRAIGIPCGT